MYNLKYVNIYDVTPDYVYMGYTPGYLNTFVYGPTVVYGTGFYYDPWFSGYYYPRPWTWGFNMCYNPWAGWSMGYGYGYGWFHLGIGRSYGYSGYARGGWWGPSVYRPPYVMNRARGYGYYGNNFNRNNGVRVNNYTTNIYRYRNDVVSRDNRGGNFNRPNNINRPNNTTNPGRFSNNNTRPNGNAQPGRAQNNVYSDRSGNVYQRNAQNNQWQQRQQNQWKPVQNNNNQQQQQVQNLNRQQQMRDRGQTRTQNFERARPATNNAPARPSGGSPRPSGGNRKGNR
jgi:hypothetical protein